MYSSSKKKLDKPIQLQVAAGGFRWLRHPRTNIGTCGTSSNYHELCGRKGGGANSTWRFSTNARADIIRFGKAFFRRASRLVSPSFVPVRLCPPVLVWCGVVWPVIPRPGQVGVGPTLKISCLSSSSGASSEEEAPPILRASPDIAPTYNHATPST